MNGDVANTKAGVVTYLRSTCRGRKTSGPYRRKEEVGRLKHKKAAEADQLPGELLKCCGEALLVRVLYWVLREEWVWNGNIKFFPSNYLFIFIEEIFSQRLANLSIKFNILTLYEFDLSKPNMFVLERI